jgi:hypothetical protein
MGCSCLPVYVETPGLMAFPHKVYCLSGAGRWVREVMLFTFCEHRVSVGADDATGKGAVFGVSDYILDSFDPDVPEGCRARAAAQEQQDDERAH